MRNTAAFLMLRSDDASRDYWADWRALMGREERAITQTTTEIVARSDTASTTPQRLTDQ